MHRPLSRLIWLRNPDVAQFLSDLATGRIPLTHQGLLEAPHWRTATYIRDLLMDSGVLPRVDRQIFLHQRWLSERLSTVTDPEHRHLLHRFATWHQLRRLRSKADKAPLGPSQTRYARCQINDAIAFLSWLSDRGRTPAQCRQADLDAWHTETSNRAAQRFLRWCMDTGHMPKLVRAAQVLDPGPLPPHQHNRAVMLRRALSDEDLPLRTRVASTLVLLYAQPVTRIARLTIDHINDDGTTLTVQLGDLPSPLPERAASLIRDYLRSADRLHGVSHRSTHWLFPGRLAGQPISATSLRGLLRAAGISPQHGRAGALRHLLLHAPAPVVAKALGYQDVTTANVADEVGATWTRYAPGDHSR
ncbi:hypothetical protein ACWGK6_23610 [Streptomyces violaceusniger]